MLKTQKETILFRESLGHILGENWNTTDTSPGPQLDVTRCVLITSSQESAWSKCRPQQSIIVANTESKSTRQQTLGSPERKAYLPWCRGDTISVRLHAFYDFFPHPHHWNGKYEGNHLVSMIYCFTENVRRYHFIDLYHGKEGKYRLVW